MDYELIDSGEGRRLERFGKYILNRPDPEVMWSKNLPDSEWQKADAIFKDGWILNNKSFPKSWSIDVDGLKPILKLTPFKHVGIFPEQKFEWDLISKLITRNSSPSNILSLFGYTGIASLMALKVGARVTHVDASRPAITWFRENQENSRLLEKPARIIIDDCLKFAEREVRRGNKYDGIIMDPPVYGHGPKGEAWNFNKDFPKLIQTVSQLLSDNPQFVIVNAYAVSNSPTTIANTLLSNLPKWEITKGELTLEDRSKRTLSTGIYAIWQK